MTKCKPVKIHGDLEMFLYTLLFFNLKVCLHTTFIQNIPALFLSCKVEWALGQRVHVTSHVITRFTSSSAAWWTFLSALGAWVGCVADNHVTVNEHKWMLCNELEGFQAKPLCADWRRRKVLHSFVTRASKKQKKQILYTAYMDGLTYNTRG